MSLLLDTGLYRILIERFDALAMSMGLPGERPANPTAGYWNGEDFNPLVQRLARAVQDKVWSDSDVAKFLYQAFEQGVATAAPDGFDAIAEAYVNDVFFRLLASSGTDAKLFFSGAPSDSLQDAAVRFFETLQDPSLIENMAPSASPTLAAGLTALEGDTITIDMASLFWDRNGDDVTVKLVSLDGALTLLGEQDGILTLRISNGLEGVFALQVVANDGQADSPVETLNLTVVDAGPGAAVMTRNQKVTLGLHDSLEQALTAGGANMAYRLLRQTGIDSDGPVSIAANNIILDGASGLSGQFALAQGARAITLRGEAAFGVTGNDLRNVMLGNAGANVLSGGAESDRLLGNGGHDGLFGGIGRDHLIGGEGHDNLFGGAQDDRLIGDAGNDVLDGGAGIDRAWGGQGADRFVFRAGEQRTMAMDFNAVEDVIQISGFAGITSLATLLDQARVVQIGADLLIALGQDRLVIKDMTQAGLVADDFAFA